jgi:hypothetical protein
MDRNTEIEEKRLINSSVLDVTFNVPEIKFSKNHLKAINPHNT